MRIAVPAETVPNERRVALTPDSVSRLVKQKMEVAVQRGAGLAAGFSNDAYAAAGAVMVDGAGDTCAGAAVVCKVQRPGPAEVPLLDEGSALVSLLQPSANGALLSKLAARRVSAFALELVPRITRAQSMDVLSSQATVAGYKAVLLGAAELPRLLPMLTTAAGSLTPARAFVIGAGVAGLQAIATARRLGAVVSAFDVRPAAKEQVQSLGASFVAAEMVAEGAQDKGGYARAQDEEQQRRTREALAAHIKDMDLVITTAQVPGRAAPRLVTESMVAGMRPGSVVVDLAAESGGNCELTRAGDSYVAHGVTIMGPVNLPSTVPLHASQMFSRNVETFLRHLVKDGVVQIDLNDEITGAMCVTHDGEMRKT
ncbi:MAG TPA: Re/Si-specific NAD(P)(+) transhydrogenase subunit alpha [Gemmatimonadaceae bacterium]|nr:Re/Si-specific NAD(P)(+) transhydrogenase subunit alpha [Gemmatimonadaceae bacterium]